MGRFLALIAVLLASGASAQQCPECTLADACIREYSAAVAKIRSEASTAEADLQKSMREMKLGETGDSLSQRGAFVLRENAKVLVRFEIDALKECLGKIR